MHINQKPIPRMNSPGKTIKYSPTKGRTELCSPLFYAPNIMIGGTHPC